MLCLVWRQLVRGKKAEKLLGSGSLCYLSLTAWDKYTKTLCLGVKAWVHRSNCAAAASRASKDTQPVRHGREGEKWSWAPCPAALPELSFYLWQGSASCSGTFQAPHVWFLSRGCEENYFIPAFSVHIRLQEQLAACVPARIAAGSDSARRRSERFLQAVRTWMQHLVWVLRGAQLLFKEIISASAMWVSTCAKAAMF